MKYTVDSCYVESGYNKGDRLRTGTKITIIGHTAEKTVTINAVLYFEGDRLLRGTELEMEEGRNVVEHEWERG